MLTSAARANRDVARFEIEEGLASRAELTEAEGTRPAAAAAFQAESREWCPARTPDEEWLESDRRAFYEKEDALYRLRAKWRRSY